MEYFGTDLREHGHYRWSLEDGIMTERNLRLDNLPFNPEGLTRNLPKGNVIFYQGGGYTVLGISGSCLDQRCGTKSIFWVREKISREEIYQRIMDNEMARKIICAIPFDIDWHS